MERADRARLTALPGSCTSRPLEGVGPVVLDEETAHHLRVRRLDVGDELRVTDGLGAIGSGPITALGKRAATVEVRVLHREPPPPPVRLLVPVADRERMLWLAEKSAELGLRDWTPLRWRRSRSVSPRGEGESFRAKVRGRMTAALIQSGGAWLPDVDVEVDGEAYAARCPVGDDGIALLLDAGGPPLLWVVAPLLSGSSSGGSSPGGAMASASSGDGRERPVTVALGPEGGLSDDEVAALVDAGFRRCSLGSRVLRFETAAIAALVLVDAARGGVAGASMPPNRA